MIDEEAKKEMEAIHDSLSPEAKVIFDGIGMAYYEAMSNIEDTPTNIAATKEAHTAFRMILGILDEQIQALEIDEAKEVCHE